MNTINDEAQENMSTTRHPLKIRNCGEKNSFKVEKPARVMKTEYDDGSKRKADFENQEQPIYNKIVQKLSDK